MCRPRSSLNIQHSILENGIQPEGNCRLMAHA
jgi:hypothetical protein